MLVPGRLLQSQRWIIGGGALLVLLLVACGSEAGPAERESVSGAPAVEQPSPEPEEAGEDGPAVGEAGEPAAPAPGPALGVTGAPVPTLAVVSADYDPERLRSGADFPPLNDPRVVLAEAATWMGPGAVVLAAVQNGDARAYPIFMVAYRYIANDALGGFPYLVTY